MPFARMRCGIMLIYDWHLPQIQTKNETDLSHLRLQTHFAHLAMLNCQDLNRFYCAVSRINSPRVNFMIYHFSVELFSVTH